MGRHHRVHGRHRAPSTAGLTAARVVAAGVAAGASLTAVPAYAAAPPDVVDTVARCESGDRNVEHGGDPGGVSTASGYFQFVDGTWKLFGGREFAPRAIAATRAEQVVVFQRAFARNGLRDWEASRACWGPKLGTARVDAPRPAPRAARGAADCGAVYEVVRGDTLARIAAAHHIPLRALIADNRDVIDDPDLIFPGERLHV